MHEKKTVQAALESNYGFHPPLKDIKILEAGDGSRMHILFSVKGHKYEFNSYHNYGLDGMDYGVWVGKGTVKERD